MSANAVTMSKREARRSDPDRVPFGRLIAWSSSHAAQGANFLILGYFTIYCTDTLKLSALVVGVLLLVSKFIDAIGVLIAGWIVDRSPETRWGKARPYDLAIVGIWVATAVLFATPAALGEAGKYAWVFVTYLLITAIFTPLFLANQPLFLARAFGTRGAYTRATTSSAIVIGIVALAVGITFPILLQGVGKSPSGWAMLVLAYAVPLTVFGLFRFFFIRETHPTERASTRATFRDIRTVLATNPYIWSVAGIQFIVAILGNIGGLTYYYRYIVGNLALQGVFGIINILALPLFLAFPRLIKRFSVSKLIAAAAVIGIFGYLVYSFAGANIPLLAVAALLTAIAALPISFLLPILIVDNATFNEWKGNRRLESVGGGITAFAMNTGGGVAAGLLGIILGLSGYDGALSVQRPSATLGIIASTSWVPAALSVIAVVVALRYHRFEKQLPVMTAEIDLRHLNVATPTPLAPTASSIAGTVTTAESVPADADEAEGENRRVRE